MLSLLSLLLQCLLLLVILVENLSYAFAPTRKSIITTTKNNSRQLFQQQQSKWWLNNKKQQQQCQNNQQLVYFYASSINDDGDFVIPGINDDDENMMTSFSDNGAGQLYVSPLQYKQEELSTTPTTASALSSNSKSSNINNGGQYLYSLLDAANNNVPATSTSTNNNNDQSTAAKSSLGSSATTTSSETASTTTTELLGLTEDGDFLMSGINAPTEIQQQESLPPTPQPSLGIPDLSIENNNNNNNIMMPKNPFAEVLELSSEDTELEQEECDTEDLNICIVEEFLISIIPSLDEHDSHRYAHILVTEFGFDPDCESSQELTLDDLLGFMKKLHARYFWKEWTKLLT